MLFSVLNKLWFSIFCNQSKWTFSNKIVLSLLFQATNLIYHLPTRQNSHSRCISWNVYVWSWCTYVCVNFSILSCFMCFSSSYTHSVTESGNVCMRTGCIYILYIYTYINSVCTRKEKCITLSFWRCVAHTLRNFPNT